MTIRKVPTPPRPLVPGDVVAAWSDDLAGWTAAQITGLFPNSKHAGVLELDWSGPEVPTIADVVGASPLRLTHHAYTGELAHSNVPWLLPRGYRVIGSSAPTPVARSDAYSGSWGLGLQLALQRRWDSGDHGPFVDPHELKLTGPQLAATVPSPPDQEIWGLIVDEFDTLDCRHLVETFPAVRSPCSGADRASSSTRMP